MLLQSCGVSLNSILGSESNYGKLILTGFLTPLNRLELEAILKECLFSFLNKGHYRGGEIHALDIERRRNTLLSVTPPHYGVCLCVAMGSHIFETLTDIQVAAGRNFDADF